MYFFTCSMYFICISSHVPCTCILYVFLQRLHVFLDMVTKACKGFWLSFKQHNNNLKSTRNHHVSCDHKDHSSFPLQTLHAAKKSSGYLTKHKTQTDILVKVIYKQYLKCHLDFSCISLMNKTVC